MATQESTDLRAEMINPSVIAPAQVGQAMTVFRPVVNKVSQQAAVLQGLLALAEEAEAQSPDEANADIISAKFESLAQTLAALQRQHDKAVEELRRLGKIMRSFKREAKDVAQTINDH